MNRSHRLSGLGITLAGLLLAGALAAPAGAAPKKVEGSGPAYVDINRLLNEYRKTSVFAKFQQKVRDQAKLFSDEMELLSQLRYCTEAEKKEALSLKAKGGNASSKEKARLEELLKKSDAVDSEASMLSQKPQPTDAETLRIQELSRMRSEALQTLAKEESERREQMRQLESDMFDEVDADLRKLVEKFAKDQKLEVLYERRAVLFGGTDLTDELIKKLPK
jgi:Skp family chaperone for outer membrane proteins